MKKIFYLHTCSTCQRILKEWNPGPDVELREIKTNPITPEELENMSVLAGSYEALFSRRAMKYKSMGLKDKNLSEADYRDLILDEYTFLKRPVAVVNNEIFVGSAAKTVEAAKTALSS